MSLELLGKFHVELATDDRVLKLIYVLAEGVEKDLEFIHSAVAKRLLPNDREAGLFVPSLHANEAEFKAYVECTKTFDEICGAVDRVVPNFGVKRLDDEQTLRQCIFWR